jgi:DNA adenine methylase
MKYMGSKSRIAKYIIPIMLNKRKPEQYWVEPFVGGGNIIDKVGGKRIGADINKYVIEALISIRDYVDELPKNNSEFTEEDYKKLRLGDNYKHKGFAGFAYSFGGKWLGGWRRDKIGQRDYVKEAYLNAIKQSTNLQDTTLTNISYQSLKIPEQSLIYCDPPYEGVTKYKDSFNTGLFWQWCREKVKDGHTVFVSEYKAPKDFECIWQKEIASSLTKNTGSRTGIEKIFIHKDMLS